MNSFDAKINTENLTKCLQTLKQFYGDLLKDKVKGVSRYHTCLPPSTPTRAMPLADHIANCMAAFSDLSPRHHRKLTQITLGQTLNWKSNLSRT